MRELRQGVLLRRLAPEEQELKAKIIPEVIARSQQENEDLDRQSTRILGNDDVFLDQFKDIRESRRYVAPEELHELLNLFLAEHFPRLRLRQSEGEADGIYRLVATRSQDAQQFSREILLKTASDPKVANVARHFAARFDPTDDLRLTFDPAIAVQRRDVEFLSFHHPVIRALRALHQEQAALGAAGLLALPARGDAAADHAFCFVYELTITAIRERVELVPVVMRGDTVDTALSASFAELVRTARPVPQRTTPAFPRGDPRGPGNRRGVARSGARPSRGRPPRGQRRRRRHPARVFADHARANHEPASRAAHHGPERRDHAPQYGTPHQPSCRRSGGTP